MISPHPRLQTPPPPHRPAAAQRRGERALGGFTSDLRPVGSPVLAVTSAAHVSSRSNMIISVVLALLACAHGRRPTELRAMAADRNATLRRPPTLALARHAAFSAPLRASSRGRASCARRRRVAAQPADEQPQPAHPAVLRKLLGARRHLDAPGSGERRARAAGRRRVERGGPLAADIALDPGDAQLRQGRRRLVRRRRERARRVRLDPRLAGRARDPVACVARAPTDRSLATIPESIAARPAFAPKVRVVPPYLATDAPDCAPTSAATAWARRA